MCDQTMPLHVRVHTSPKLYTLLYYFKSSFIKGVGGLSLIYVRTHVSLTTLLFACFIANLYTRFYSIHLILYAWWFAHPPLPFLMTLLNYDEELGNQVEVNNFHVTIDWIVEQNKLHIFRFYNWNLWMGNFLIFHEHKL